MIGNIAGYKITKYKLKLINFGHETFFLETSEIVWVQQFVVLRWGTLGLTEAPALPA